ncbi:MAG: leucyl aminopeptidase [Planctomycetota bacterium]|nr:leucyl aminopeptidase [Planctomycetota bacterium]
MKVDVKTQGLGRLRDEACVLFADDVSASRKLVRRLGAEAYDAYRGLLDRDAFAAKAGELVTLHQGAKARVPTVVVVGVGADADLESLRQAAAKGVRAARDAGATSVSLAAPLRKNGKGTPRPVETASFLVEGAIVGLYRFETYKGTKAEKDVNQLSVVGMPDDASRLRKGAAEGEALASGVLLARDLGNEPGNTATPTHLATVAEDLAARESTLEVRVLEEDEMQALGMGSLLGVGRGSAQPSKLIVLTYTPPRSKKKVDTVALVGKGITFDTGGISIKPSAKLEDMKFDMCGGAAVIGAMQSIARIQPKVRVLGLVPAVENMPGADAYKPGDILEAMNGTTIEVRNTDAEGRLILADALTYAATKMRPKPKAIVDLATLTGAAIVALGYHHGALISSDEKLAARLMDASERSGDALWRLPINDAYRKQLKSPYADVSNLGSPGAGTITAGAFLEKFVEGVPWAHLDIAGMAWTERQDGTFTKGATGFGVRVLARLLQRW